MTTDNQERSTVSPVKTEELLSWHPRMSEGQRKSVFVRVQAEVSGSESRIWKGLPWQVLRLAEEKLQMDLEQWLGIPIVTPHEFLERESPHLLA